MRSITAKNRVLNLDDLQICEAYQRTVVRARVNHIKKHYDPDALGSICVGERNDGTFWIVDGQQRVTALKEMGIVRVSCDIFESRGKSHEAQIFRQKNKHRTSVSARGNFKAALTEGDPQAIAIQATVESAGLSLMLEGGSKGWPQVCCVGALASIFEDGGAEHLTRVLNVVCKSWKGESDALQGTILQGLGVFLMKADVDDKRLTLKMKKVEPMAVLRFADSQRKLLGGGRSGAVATAFLNFYNKGASKKAVFEES
jgi:hypothetical protein